MHHWNDSDNDILNYYKLNQKIMKKFNWKLLVPLLAFAASIFFCNECVAQEINPAAYEYDLGIPAKAKNPNAVKMLVINFMAVAFDGFSDGLYDEGKATGENGYLVGSHILDAASIGMHLSKGLLYEDMNTRLWFKDALIYTGMRFTFFDATYNSARGYPVWDYGGETSLYGKFWNKVDPGPHILWAKGIVFVATIKISF